MAAPNNKSLNDLVGAPAQIVLDVFSSVNGSSLTYRPADSFEVNSLDETFKALLQIAYNYGYENGEKNRTAKTDKEKENGRSTAYGDDGEDKGSSDSEYGTEKATAAKTPGGSTPYWQKGEFGCHRVKITKANMGKVRPNYQFTTRLFDNLQDHETKQIYLDNDEVEDYKLLVPGWKASKPIKYKKEFEDRNEAASQKLKSDNQDKIRKGLGLDKQGSAKEATEKKKAGVVGADDGDNEDVGEDMDEHDEMEEGDEEAADQMDICGDDAANYESDSST